METELMFRARAAAGFGAWPAVAALGRRQSAARLLRRPAVDRNTRGRPRTARRDRV